MRAVRGRARVVAVEDCNRAGIPAAGGGDRLGIARLDEQPIALRHPTAQQPRLGRHVQALAGRGHLVDVLAVADLALECDVDAV
jgi:hypothetical protein